MKKIYYISYLILLTMPLCAQFNVSTPMSFHIEKGNATFNTQLHKAQQGDKNAQFSVGYSFANGDGVTQDYDQAVYWYRKAAEQGNTNAQCNLGFCYSQGNGVTKDKTLAVLWYRKAAEQGNKQAQYNLGVCYDDGAGIAKDNTQAVYWYRKAAEQGHAAAQNSLGLMYDDGLGVGQDYNEAGYWYHEAALQGSMYAMNNLGNLYENGYGVKKDYPAAMFWYKKASDNNNVSGRKNYDRLAALGYKEATEDPYLPKDPPQLKLVSGSLSFSDPSGNDRIDANEKSTIQFKIRNEGKGAAKHCEARIKISGASDGISANPVTLPTIEAGETYEVRIPVSADIGTQDGKATFTLEVYEPRGWGIAPFDLIVATKAYEPPYLQVVDYTISSLSGAVYQLESFTCTFNLQNTQYGNAEEVKVKINLPNNIYKVRGDTMLTYPIIKAGEKEMIQITLIATSNYAESYIPITIDIKEKYGKYAENKQLNIELLKQASTSTEITVKEEKSKFKIISSQNMALSISGTPHIGILANTSVAIMRPEWYNKYNNPQNIKSPFPYAVIQLELKGDKESVEIAKQTLSLVMGGKHIVEAKDDNESNTIYFLVHCRNEYVDLDCGDGCEPINIWKARLEPNKVYKGCVSISVNK